MFLMERKHSWLLFHICNAHTTNERYTRNLFCFFSRFCYIDFSNLFESMVWLYYDTNWEIIFVHGNLWIHKIKRYYYFLIAIAQIQQNKKMNDEKREIKTIWWFHLPSSNLDATRFTITCFFLVSLRSTIKLFFFTIE